MNTALLIARLFFGLGLAGHGTQKLFGWYGGHGLSGTGGFFETLGFRPGRFFATAAPLAKPSEAFSQHSVCSDLLALR